jgi:glycosyltransferase involved in cell wall biosynthesis
LRRIPEQLVEQYEMEVLVIDDASSDRTFEFASAVSTDTNFSFPVRVLSNPVNQGYGGNQKIGYWYAMENSFDYVALIHGDGQYAPECLPQLLDPLERGEADAVLGSRMTLPGEALSGGMPLYKYIGNRILTRLQNMILGTDLSEFHSGYRIYSVAALRKIPFDLNTNDFHFDTEIILQLLLAEQRIKEVPIPTYYGDEICYVNGLAYAANVCLATAKMVAQRFNLFYDRKYDCAPDAAMNKYYIPKLDYRSSHSLALSYITKGSRVLDLGCGRGYVGAALKEHLDCYVVGVDRFPCDEPQLDRFVLHNLDTGFPEFDDHDFDHVLLLDVIEHLAAPEEFFAELRQQLLPDTTLILSTGNVGFFLTRLSLLFGSFRYGKRGILDLTHHRLFTLNSIKELLIQANYDILDTAGTPIPFPLVLGDGLPSRVLLAFNTFLLTWLPRLFSFQFVLIVRPRPTLNYLLAAAEEEGRRRHQRLDRPLGPEAQLKQVAVYQEQALRGLPVSEGDTHANRF